MFKLVSTADWAVKLNAFQTEAIEGKYNRNARLLSKMKTEQAIEKYEDILWNLNMIIAPLGYEF